MEQNQEEKKTITVRKEFTARYDILSDVIVSPVRIEILNKLSDHPDGLSYEDLVNLLRPELRQKIQSHKQLRRLDGM